MTTKNTTGFRKKSGNYVSDDMCRNSLMKGENNRLKLSTTSAQNKPINL